MLTRSTPLDIQFSREYTDKGYKGGSSAAIELQKRVEKYFRSEKNIAKGTRIDILAYSFALVHYSLTLYAIHVR